MQRIAQPFWILTGIIFVIFLTCMGVDLCQAARTGPRWRRRLITIALIALASFGLISAVSAGEAVATQKTADDAELGRNSDWKEIAATWAEAKQIAANKRGDYPFLNATAKQHLLDRLAKSEKQCEKLATAGLLTAAEAGLLQKGLQDLTKRAQVFRAKTEMMWTCYKMMISRPAVESSQRLQLRLDLLKKLAEQPTIHQTVLARVLETVEADLAVLSDEKNWQNLSAEEKENVTKTRDEATEPVRKLKARLSTSAIDKQLEETREWQTITRAWGFCAPFAHSGKSTEAQRKQVNEKLEATKKAIAALTAARLLSNGEATLLQQEADKLRTDIYTTAPTDFRGTCYDMAFVPPAHQSLERLSQRLGLLRNLVKSDRLHRSVVEKLLPTLEADLQTLDDEKAIEQLSESERGKARELHQQAAALVQQLQDKP